jgi:hypothetical protein
MAPFAGTFRYYNVFDLEHSNLVWTCIYWHHLHFYGILAQSGFKYGRQVAILENQQWAITPELRDHFQIIRSKSETKQNGFPCLADFKIHS